MARFTGVGGGGGAPGPQGPSGDDGASAYDIAVENGFVGTEQEWLDSLGGSGADIADFIFVNEDENVSSITLPVNKEMTIETTRDDDGDADINIRAADDVFITATGDDINLDAFNEVNISSNDDSYEWVFDNSGNLQLPGDGYISNPVDSSGDPNPAFNDTIHLVPDSSLEDDRYLIIDPTSPNHIHIRPGGTIDESTAELYIGGERTHIVQDDGAHEVRVSTGSTININSYLNINNVNNSNFIAESGPIMVDVGYKVNVGGTDYVVDAVTPDTPAPGNVLVSVPGATFQNGQNYTFRGDDGTNNYWMFGSDGYLYGPDEGGLYVQGIDNPDSNLYINSGNSIILSGANGEFLNDSEDADNQIATIGDISDAISDSSKAFGSFYSLSDQGPYTANAIQPFTYTNAGTVSNVSLANNSQIVFEKAGTYNIAFSAQLHQTNSSGTINIWLKKNGSNIPASNTKMAITSNNPYYVAAWNLFIDVNANDYIELIWSSTSQHTVIEHEPITGSGATEHPEVPSVVLTVNQVA